MQEMSEPAASTDGNESDAEGGVERETTEALTEEYSSAATQ